MNYLGFRHYLPLVCLVVSGGVSAVGLGELRGQPHLGEPPRLEVDLLGADALPMDAACFRVIQPSGSGELPWLKRATFNVRKGMPKVLEIRSETPVRDPILELAVYLGCGHEISRQYVLFASPAPETAPPVAESRPRRDEPATRATRSVPTALPQASASPGAPELPPRLMPRRPEKRTSAREVPDRLMLSTGIDVGEPSLRLATELWGGRSRGAEVREAQREILRLEFRMLMALNEQATSQMATAEKLRHMEGTLGELQQRAAEFAQRVEQEVKPVESSAPKIEPTAARPMASAPDPVPAKPEAAARPLPPIAASSGLSEWSLYGVLLGILLGLGGWLGWKNYRERQERSAAEGFHRLAPAIAVDPRRDDEHEQPAEIDLPVEPAMDIPMRVDLELDGGDAGVAKPSGLHREVPPMAHDPVMSISATTVDEHFEANPVMELADIMLSFGRIKGAAQALQEYIDNNPQEALQPWIRLMDVYRMAGMRTEFESVARNLNQNFNVEIQRWDDPRTAASQFDGEAGGEGAPPPLLEPRPESLEDMPRIADMVCELWPTGDVVGYLYQLLRDNRGGKRQGFSLPVVDEILFLIELKETSNRIQ